MANLVTKHEFNGDISKVFSGIHKYERYTDYIPGVTKVEVLPARAAGSACQVRYELNIVKTFYYVLDMFEEKPGKIWWKLAESNLMKRNDGSWQFNAAGATKTEATYSLDVDFKGLVPSAIANQVAKSTLPGLFSGMQKLIDA